MIDWTDNKCDPLADILRFKAQCEKDKGYKLIINRELELEIMEEPNNDNFREVMDFIDREYKKQIASLGVLEKYLDIK